MPSRPSRPFAGFATLIAVVALGCTPYRAGGAIDVSVLARGRDPVVPRSMRMAFDRMEVPSAGHSPLGSVILPSIIRSAPGDVRRPLIVVFNGGPGAASGWLQLGLLGPLLAVIPDDPAAPMPRQPRLVANPDGLWNMADMLFVDPLGTGFSRAVAGAPDATIHDWRSDGVYISRLIRDWMGRHRRRGAPVVLLGESYGTERAVAVADALTSGANPLHLRGLVLVSQSIMTGNSLWSQGKDLGIALGLPTMAATACYFDRAGHAAVPPERCANRALAFALGEYLPALDAGNRLAAPRRAAVVARLAGMTGLPAASYGGSGFALTDDEYIHRAFAERKLVLGVHDSRYAAPADPAQPWQDPSIDALLPAMTDAAGRANRLLLGFDRSPVDGSPYVLFNWRIPARWHYGESADPHKSLAMKAMLGRTLRRTGARLMIAGGLFDGSGSYGADRYLAAHLGLPRGRVELRSYPGGHMFYLNSAGRRGFTQSLRQFVGGRPDELPQVYQ